MDASALNTEPQPTIHRNDRRANLEHALAPRVARAALVVLVACVACRPRPASDGPESVAAPEEPVMAQHNVQVQPQPRVQSPPTVHEAMQRPCEVGEGATMRSLMTDHINRKMTEISYILHHDGRSQQDRMPAVTEATAELLSCIQAIPDYRSGIPLARRAEYYALLSELQADAFALHVASLEMNEDASNHWFFHLKQDCASCHARFRAE